MLAIITGSAFVKDSNFESEKEVSTDYGNVNVGIKDNVYFLQRHGNGVPPHKINHRANIMALSKLGVEKIISITSCGSLKKDYPPGTILIPEDYMDLTGNDTFFEEDMQFSVPGFDNHLREELLRIAKLEGIDVVDGGIYWQSRGPRFETKAEVKMISNFADMVGMTMANEATLANELGICYANVSIIDNYAHGLTDLSIEDWQKQQEYHSKQVVPKYIEAIKGLK